MILRGPHQRLSYKTKALPVNKVFVNKMPRAAIEDQVLVSAVLVSAGLLQKNVG